MRVSADSCPSAARPGLDNGSVNPLKRLKLYFNPPKIDDPDFGQLRFMYISNHPEQSYWEAEYLFPPTGTPISIGLAEDESGPKPEVRAWYLELPSRFEKILDVAKPQLAKVFKTWRDEDLPDDIFTVVKLSGFDVECPLAQPVEWTVSFETIDHRLAITIPFVDDKPSEAIIDT